MLEDIILFYLDHRQPPPFGIDAVVMPSEFLLAREKFLAFGEPLVTGDDRRMPGFRSWPSAFSSQSDEIFRTIDDVRRVAEIADIGDLAGRPSQQHEVFRR
jgi:hypothetical protein